MSGLIGAIASMAGLTFPILHKRPSLSTPAGLKGDVTGDVPASSEARDAEIFSLYLAELIRDEPSAVVSHYWQGDHGLLVVRPEDHERLEAKIADSPVAVKVEASTADAVPLRRQLK